MNVRMNKRINIEVEPAFARCHFYRPIFKTIFFKMCRHRVNAALDPFGYMSLVNPGGVAPPVEFKSAARKIVVIREIVLMRKFQPGARSTGFLNPGGNFTPG